MLSAFMFWQRIYKNMSDDRHRRYYKKILDIKSSAEYFNLLSDLFYWIEGRQAILVV